MSLGSWQLYRLNWKLNLISEINDSLKNDPVKLTESDKKNYLRIRTSGRIDFDNSTGSFFKELLISEIKFNFQFNL